MKTLSIESDRQALTGGDDASNVASLAAQFACGPPKPEKTDCCKFRCGAIILLCYGWDNRVALGPWKHFIDVNDPHAFNPRRYFFASGLSPRL